MASVRLRGWIALGPLLATVSAAGGCKWVPVRQPEGGRRAAPEPAARPALPPLPSMRAIDDAEAFRATQPTPLLDAAAERDAELKRAITTETTTPTDPPAPADPAPAGAAPDADRRPAPDPLVEPASFAPPPAPPDSPADAPPIAAKAEPSGTIAAPEADAVVAPGGSLWDHVLSALAESTTDEEPTREPVEATRPGPPPMEPPFAIADLRVCRRVLGFGRTEALPSESVEPGQPILVYCEIEGQADEESPEGFRSRLATSAQIVAAEGGEPAWRGDLGIVEDRCRRRRRDFFVTYRLAIPQDLAPGRYEIRITQTDLLAHREAARAVGLVVRPK